MAPTLNMTWWFNWNVTLHTADRCGSVVAHQLFLSVKFFWCCFFVRSFFDRSSAKKSMNSRGFGVLLAVSDASLSNPSSNGLVCVPIHVDESRCAERNLQPTPHFSNTSNSVCAFLSTVYVRFTSTSTNAIPSQRAVLILIFIWLLFIAHFVQFPFSFPFQFVVTLGFSLFRSVAFHWVSSDPPDTFHISSTQRATCW